MFLLVLRNIQRRPFHTLLTVFTVAVAVAALFTSLWLGRGMERGLALGLERLGADIVVLPDRVEATPEQVLFTGLPLNIYMDESVYEQVLVLPGVQQATPQFYTQTLVSTCCSFPTAGRLVGFDPQTDFALKPWLENLLGRDMEANEVVVGANVDELMIGMVLIHGQVYRVVGQLEPTGTGIDESMFVLLDKARSLGASSPELRHLWSDEGPDNLISAVLVRVESPEQAAAVAKTIGEIPGVQAVQASQVVRDMQQRMNTVTIILYALTGVLWLVSLVSLLGRFASVVVERKTETGVLRALGARRGSVFQLILWEASGLALVGGLLGLGLGWFVSRFVVGWVVAETMFPFLSLPLLGVASLFLWCLLAAVGTVVLSALIPAYYSASLDPARAIAMGELE